MSASTHRESAVIVAARRTPIGAKGGALAGTSVECLAAPVLTALVADLGIEPATVDDVVLGNCMGPGGNVARVAALAAGLPPTVPGLTVDRQCASGLAAINLAADSIQAGTAHRILAGGAESPSTAPVRASRPIDGGELRPYDRAPMAPAPYSDPDMGYAADRLALEVGIRRERQDAYAARSHARAVAALAAGSFDAEVVPVAGSTRDERPRRRLDVARLSRFPPVFVPTDDGGTVTAGNSCGVNDGAAAVAIVDESTRAALRLAGLRIVGTACVGVDPGRPGLGPVPAIRALLDRHGYGIDDLGVVEIVEAFAGQVLACADALGLDTDRICPDGGALGLGHPWGASGAVVMVRLFTRLVRERAGGLGVAAAAAGGGLGVATLVEYVPAGRNGAEPDGASDAD